MLDYFEILLRHAYRNLWQFSIHQNDPTLRCIPAKRDHVNSPLFNFIYRIDLRGCLHDPALPGCNEAWDRFDVLKIAISCNTCLSKIVLW